MIPVNLNESAPSGIDGPKEVSLFQAAARTARDGVAYQTVTPDLFVRPLNTATRNRVLLAGAQVVHAVERPLAAVQSDAKVFLLETAERLAALVGHLDVEKGERHAGSFHETEPRRLPFSLRVKVTGC